MATRTALSASTVTRSGGNWQRIANATGAKFDAYMPDLRADGGRLPFSKIMRPPMETSAS